MLRLTEAPHAPDPPFPSSAAAELHHGHGGENAALANSAETVPGGRPRGAQLLDPPLQRRRGAEEGRHQWPVQAAEPGGAGEQHLRWVKTFVFQLFQGKYCWSPVIFFISLIYLFFNETPKEKFSIAASFPPQKSTGSCCTGPCLDTFQRRSGRRLVRTHTNKSWRLFRESVFSHVA